MGMRREWFVARVAAEGLRPVGKWLGYVAGSVAGGAAVAAVVQGWRIWRRDWIANSGVDWAAAADAFRAGEGGSDLLLAVWGVLLCGVSLIVVLGMPGLSRWTRAAVALRPWRPYAGGMELAETDRRYGPRPQAHLRTPRGTRLIESAPPSPQDDSEDAEPEPVPGEGTAPVADAETGAESVPEPAAGQLLGTGTSQGSLPLDGDGAEVPVRMVLPVMSRIGDLTGQAVEALAWTYVQGGFISPGEMSRVIAVKREAVAKRCQRLALKGWLKQQKDGSYEMPLDVRADIDLLRSAAQRDDETTAAGIAGKMSSRPFSQVRADWLDVEFGGPSYRDQLAARARGVLDECVEVFPDSADVFETAMERVTGIE